NCKRTCDGRPSQCSGVGERRGLPPAHERSLDLDALSRLDDQEPWRIRYETAQATEERRRQVHPHLPSARAAKQRLSPGPRDTDVDVVQEQARVGRAHDSTIEVERDALAVLPRVVLFRPGETSS